MVINKKIRKIILYCALVYCCLVAALYVFQRTMIYFPSRGKPEIAPYQTQGVFEIKTRTVDGLELSGWMRTPDPEKPVIMFFHGNASTMEMALSKAAPYAEAGYGFLLAEYRGYSGNPGNPSETGFYRDARAWIARLNNLGILPENIVLYGESIGTGVAVQLATEFPDVKAVILESPYTSLPAVAARTYFFVPVNLLMKDRFDNLSKINKVKAPLLIMQGKKDRIIPSELGQELYNKANEPKSMFKLDDYGHNNMPDALKSSYALKFLNNINQDQ